MTPFDNDNAGFAAGGSRGSPLVGGRWALALAVALLAAYAGLDLFRWWRAASPAALETIVQQPVSADDPATESRPAVTAPDPGDNP